VESALESGGGRRLKVIKCGRTTHWKMGCINEIQGSCTRKGDNLKTTEVTVINVTRWTPFCDEGDSGALVLDVKGRIVGILHSLHEKDNCGSILSRITLIDNVIDDIKAVTGSTEVTFMGYAGDNRFVELMR
jgi:hypothetical protein